MTEPETSILGSTRGKNSGDAFCATNPATGEHLNTFYAPASEAETERSAELAEQASLRLAALSGSEKGKFLRAIADGVDHIVEELVSIMTAETGLPEPRVRGETGRTSGQLRMFADLVEEGSWVDARIDHAIPDRQPIPKPDIRSMLRPIGPVGVFCASNFPLAFSVAGGDTASAFAAGCPVIVKAHHAHPGTALAVGKVVQAAVASCGLPEGTFSLLYGGGRTVGQHLVRHPSLKAVGFTGSRSGGRALFDLAASRPEPIPVYAEMSSVNPIFLLPSALADRGEQIAEGLLGSATLGVGQFCTNPGIVLHDKGELGEKFKNDYAKLMGQSSAAPMLHSGIRDAYGQGVSSLSSRPQIEALNDCGDDRGQGNCDAQAAVFAADAAAFLSDEALSEEIFGPSTLLVGCDGMDQMLEVARNLEGQLTATIFGSKEEIAAAEDLVAILETKAGRLLLNQFPTGVEVCQSIVHGGPYPATADGRSTSVGTAAILRFARPVCYQGFPDEHLPDELRDNNPLGINRLIDGDKA
ncbi:MAG: aldehyde dehydrogenase (NADP(+)) [Opitutae bacterium]|nr:aldehyde dehydrogenase (NADP(+)) [Opitutae bacterium]|tara:strand:+ start:872 stop:2452 length:1581 start_codon:yes stop_codon:yes gene_type:complete